MALFDVFYVGFNHLLRFSWGFTSITTVYDDDDGDDDDDDDDDFKNRGTLLMILL